MNKTGSPLSAKEILDQYFLENRARLLEIAAFLDRVDRAEGSAVAPADFRYRAFLEAARQLLSTDGGRIERLQLTFSDLSGEPCDSAAGRKGAVGAWEGKGK